MILNRSLKENTIIIVSVIVAMVLMILPLPQWTIYARPEWVFVVLLFWLTYTPKRVGPLIAWALGLFMDLLLGTTLGAHAFIYVCFAYVVQKFLRVIQAMPLWQSTLGVGFCTLLNVLLQFFIARFSGVDMGILSLLLPVITSMLVWPWLYFLCRDVRATEVCYYGGV